MLTPVCLTTTPRLMVKPITRLMAAKRITDLRSLCSSLGGTGSHFDLSRIISTPAMPKTAPDAPAPAGNAARLWLIAHSGEGEYFSQLTQVDNRLPAAPVRR